jgi:signal transduction histidine kinase/CheY-like chemotaxis protein
MERSATPVVKDRKILRRVDYGAARNSVLGLLSALLVYAFLGVWGNFWVHHQALTVGFGLAILMLTAYRLLLVVRFDQLHGAAPGRWRKLFGTGLVLHSVIWGLLMAVVGGLNGLNAAFVVICIYNIGVATALGTSWMGSLRVRQSCVLFMFSPAMVALVATGEMAAVVLAILLGFYSFYLFRVLREQHLAFWHAMARERRPASRPVADGQQTGRSIQLSLVYRLAHELRTPMNSMMGMLSLMEDTELSSEQKEYHQVASQSGKLLLSLIDDVLDYSRILTGRITLNPDFFDLRAAIEQTLEAFGPMAERNGLELTCVVDRHLPRRVRGDRERVLQVLTNLLSNAIKFSETGEIRISIGFNPLSERDGMLRVSVMDQGIGMDPVTLNGLFQDQFLGPQADMANARNTGFGLLVCKGLVEAMEGEIGAQSVQGEGSTIWFTARLGMQPDMRESGELSRAIGSSMALVAGASAGTEMVLQEEFDALGSSCHPADSYDHALQALREGRREDVNFQLLLIDTWSRRDSALNLCRTVLDDPALEQVKPVLLVTIEERALAPVQKLVEKYGLSVMVKPVHRSGLRNALRHVYGIKVRKPVADRARDTEMERQERRSYRLLLVEDNEINQLVARGMLDKLGYQVKVANGGGQALNLLERERFDLILMDCMMPDVDGFEVTRQLREMEQGGERVPIIAITANTAEGAQSRCMAAGMDDYLAKPIHLSELESVLRHWLPEQQSSDTDETDS